MTHHIGGRLPAPQLLDQPSRFLIVLLIYVGEHQGGSFAGKCKSRCAADTHGAPATNVTFPSKRLLCLLIEVRSPACS